MTCRTSHREAPSGGKTFGCKEFPGSACGHSPMQYGRKSRELSHNGRISPSTHLQTQAAVARSAKHTRITKAITARIASLLQMASRKGTISSRRMHDDQPQLLLHVKQ